MASNISQGLQNCLETLHVHEKTEKLGSNDNKAQEHNVKEGWSFLQALTNTIQNNNENDKVYVHPLTKSSSSALSEKSLEMCTESLGSETGSDGSQSCDEMPLISSESRPKEISRTRMVKTYNRDGCFPPPLKTFGSSRGVQVKSHREGGRLILEAVLVTPTVPCFHAERSEGRVRLRFFEDCCLDSVDKGKQVQEEGEYDHDDIEFEGDYNDSVVDFDEEIEGASEIADDETAMGKFPRPCRCKEGGHGNKEMQNWEPFWVAT